MTTHQTSPHNTGQDFNPNGSSTVEGDRPRTADESTQTNGFPEPEAGKLTKKDLESKTRWTVESGMS
jgi:hypothetical protein